MYVTISSLPHAMKIIKVYIEATSREGVTMSSTHDKYHKSEI